MPKEWSINGHYTAVHVKDAKAKETSRLAQMEERPSAERKVANSEPGLTINRDLKISC